MKASLVRVSEMKSVKECRYAIDAIEMDYANCVGGHRAFFSGKQTVLTKAAQSKIDAINRKADTFTDEE